MYERHGQGWTGDYESGVKPPHSKNGFAAMPGKA